MSVKMQIPKIKKLTPKGIFLWIIGISCFKFLFFDLVWALDTTFSGFQFPWGYLTKIILATALASPMLAARSRWYAGITGFLLDIWLIANLMYFRTYYTVIPSTSYMLVGNLADFQDSVWESLRWSDTVFPLSTVIMLAALSRTDIKAVLSPVIKPMLKKLTALLLIPSSIVAIHIAWKGGYKAAYEDLLYDFSTCGAAVYTIPGAMIYEHLAGATELTPELRNRIITWLDTKPKDQPLPFSIEARDNCIIILAESFESWVLETVVEGNEITPNLNRLLREDNVLYAPHIQSQVKGSRSIDAQLLIHKGLLPVNYGSYSYRFPHHSYMSIDKAFKEKYPDGTALTFTVDKKTVWNVAIVAQDFGYDRLIDKPYFVLDVKTGPRHRLGDDSFLRQSYGKIENEDMWKTEGHTLLQLVTYSGHTPFVIPDELKKIYFSDRIPERLRNYMQVANYTDRAIGEFISRLRSNPKFDNTMIVITGDHEGIGVDRNTFVKDKEIAEWLSPHQFTPLIVLNSPVTMRYEGVSGQVDIYPTLLDLMGLDGYSWRGLGQSILQPGKIPFAITPQMDIIGEKPADDSITRHAKEAYDISDLMISCDYFKAKDLRP